MAASAAWLALGALVALAWSAEAKLKVVGIGFGRTGTQTLRKALEKLDFKVLGDAEFVWNETVRKTFFDAQRTGKLDGLRWLVEKDGYNASTGLDEMAPLVWQLYGNQSDTKAILTVRNPTAYYKSLYKHQFWESRYLRDTVGFERWNHYCQNRSTLFLWNALLGPIWDEFEYGCNFCLYWHGPAQHKRCEGYFDYRVDQRRELVSDPRQLLEFDVKDGWGPLCSFLGIPVPSQRFPRRDGDTLKQWAFWLWMVKFWVEQMVLFGVYFGLPLWLLVRKCRGCCRRRDSGKDA